MMRKALLAWMLSASASAKRSVRTNRSLQTREWSQCVELAMSPEECKELVEVQSKQIPNVSVVVVEQEDQNSQSYFQPYYQVPIHTNIYGQVSCAFHNNGVVSYKFSWEPLVGNSYSVPSINCAGLGGVECCTQMKQQVKELDVQGNYLECHILQNPLVPVWSQSDSTVTYQTDYWDEDSEQCLPEQMTPEQVQSLDKELEGSINSHIEVISSDILSHGTASCEQLQALEQTLLMDTRNFDNNSGLQDMIQKLSCYNRFTTLAREVTEEHEDTLKLEDLTPELTLLVRKIQKALKDNVLKSSLETTITILASSDGLHVLQAPTLGSVMTQKTLGEELAEPTLTGVNPEEDMVDDELCVIDVGYGADAIAVLDPADDICVDEAYARQINGTDASIQLLERTVHYDTNEQDSGDVRTKFHYNVCTSGSTDVTTITISWLGECWLTAYSFFGSMSNVEEDGVTFGLDSATCESGIHFSPLADETKEDTGEVCRTYTLEFQGNVPSHANTKATVTFVDETFMTLDMEGPDCSFCILSG